MRKVGLKMATNLLIRLPSCLMFKGKQYHGDSYGPYAPPIETVRSFFPETWIWDLLEVGVNGKRDVSLTVPDTITTWEMDAFCLSSQGFGLAPRKEMKVFQPFFLELTMPYSIIRGEHFELKCLQHYSSLGPEEQAGELRSGPSPHYLDSGLPHRLATLNYLQINASKTKELVVDFRRHKLLGSQLEPIRWNVEGDVITQQSKTQVTVTPEPSSDYTLTPLSGDMYTSCLCANERKTLRWTMISTTLGEHQAFVHHTARKWQAEYDSSAGLRRQEVNSQEVT
ncbi:alpha-2-macroglobulin-P-like [Pelmatolapia mariae]|uniref:alpha-2-macroglobulin-P-like n=1 Tax=Pelmatolapia mariae TaxID=158779 RepID=UPI003211F3FD